MKHEVLKLSSGRSVFRYEVVKYQPTTEEASNVSDQKNFSNVFLRATDDDSNDCPVYVEGCIRRLRIDSIPERLHHAWLLDPINDLCLELTRLPTNVKVGDKIPNTEVEYYGCEFTKEELTPRNPRPAPFLLSADEIECTCEYLGKVTTP